MPLSLPKNHRHPQAAFFEFDYRLSVLQIHQDNNSHSENLREYFDTHNDKALSYFFFGIDQREPNHAFLMLVYRFNHSVSERFPPRF